MTKTTPALWLGECIGYYDLTMDEYYLLKDTIPGLASLVVVHRWDNEDEKEHA